MAVVSHKLESWDIVVIALYFVVILGIGLWVGTKSKPKAFICLICNFLKIIKKFQRCMIMIHRFVCNRKRRNKINSKITILRTNK